MWGKGSGNAPFYPVVSVFFSSGTRRDFCPGCEVRNCGFIKEVLRDGTPRTERLLHHSTEGERYFRYLLWYEPADAWEHYTKNNLLRLYGEYLGKSIVFGNPEWRERVEPLIRLGERDFYSLTSMMETVFLRWNTKHLEQAERWAKQAERLRPRALLKRDDEARFLYLKGFVLLKSGDRDAAVSAFRESAAVYNNPENMSGEMLMKLGETGR